MKSTNVLREHTGTNGRLLSGMLFLKLGCKFSVDASASLVFAATSLLLTSASTEVPEQGARLNGNSCLDPCLCLQLNFEILLSDESIRLALGAQSPSTGNKLLVGIEFVMLSPTLG